MTAGSTARPAETTTIMGFVASQFEGVREAFIQNFERRKELGAACCIYYRGEKVVDLWGGVRNEVTREPWQEDTMVIVFSATKGMAGLALALAHSRGLLDYDERVQTYWPEFAENGKQAITVRQLLAHQAGLFAFDELSDRSVLENQAHLAKVLARQVPSHPPGQRQYYHALTLGYYESELLRRVDPKHRSLGKYFRDEIAVPLGLDFHIGLPEEIPISRLAKLRQSKVGLSALFKVPLGLLFASLYPQSAVRRALVGSLLPLDDDRIYTRNFEVPAGGGVGTARAIARAYSAFANGGKELGLTNWTLRELSAPLTRPSKGFRDGALKVAIPFSLGFARPFGKYPFGSPGSYGAPGAGGSFGFADPEDRLGYAYVTNAMGTSLIDPRDLALRSAMWRAIGRDR